MSTSILHRAPAPDPGPLPRQAVAARRHPQRRRPDLRHRLRAAARDRTAATASSSRSLERGGGTHRRSPPTSASDGSCASTRSRWSRRRCPTATGPAGRSSFTTARAPDRWSSTPTTSARRGLKVVGVTRPAVMTTPRPRHPLAARADPAHARAVRARDRRQRRVRDRSPRDPRPGALDRLDPASSSRSTDARLQDRRRVGARGFLRRRERVLLPVLAAAHRACHPAPPPRGRGHPRDRRRRRDAAYIALKHDVLSRAAAAVRQGRDAHRLQLPERPLDVGGGHLRRDRRRADRISIRGIAPR